MGPIPFDPGLLFSVLFGSWPRLARLDGPPLGRGAQTALLFLYFQWMGSVVLPWCLLVLALGWSVWWCIVPLALYVGLMLRLCVGWQAVKAGEVVPRRRRLMRPGTRWNCGILLSVLLVAVLAGLVYAGLHRGTSPVWGCWWPCGRARSSSSRSFWAKSLFGSTENLQHDRLSMAGERCFR